MSEKERFVEQKIESWLKNRHADFFLQMIAEIEPKHLNPTAVIASIARFDYKTNLGTIYATKKMIDEEKKDGVAYASKERKALYYTFERLKKYAILQNKLMQRNFDLLYEKHKEIGTPYVGILFHIYCFIKWGIKFESEEHGFGRLVHSMVTDNRFILEPELMKIDQAAIVTHQNKVIRSKIKSKWVDRAVENGHILGRRKINLFPNQIQTQKKETQQ